MCVCMYVPNVRVVCDRQFIAPPSLPVQVSDYFSYEHFYVIYCKFWEIDVDHNLEVSLDDTALWLADNQSRDLNNEFWLVVY